MHAHCTHDNVWIITNSNHKTFAQNKNQVSQLQAANIEHKKTITSLKRAQGEPTNDDDDDIEDAGNSFGGKSKKVKKKE